MVRPSGEVLRVREPEQTSGTFRYADTHEVGNYWPGWSIGTRPSNSGSPSTSTRPRWSPPRPLARSCRPASARGPCSTAESRESGRHHPTIARGNEPLGVVLDGCLDRSGPGSFPRQSRCPGGPAAGPCQFTRRHTVRIVTGADPSFAGRRATRFPRTSGTGLVAGLTVHVSVNQTRQLCNLRG